MRFKDLEKRLACDNPNRVRPQSPTCIVWYNSNTAEIYGTSRWPPPNNIVNIQDRAILNYDEAHSCPYAKLAMADLKLICLEHDLGLRVHSPMRGPPNCRRLRPGLKRVLKQIAEFRIKKGYDPKQAELKL